LELRIGSAKNFVRALGILDFFTGVARSSLEAIDEAELTGALVAGVEVLCLIEKILKTILVIERSV
jgi:hypothetical protein